MIEVIGIIALVLLLSSDGIMAYYSMHIGNVKIRDIANNRRLISELPQKEPAEELSILRQRKKSVQFPTPVLARGGFTGRGSPFLTRDQYSTIENIEKSIERIIRK